MSLVVKDLTKRYGDKVVVDHLSFAMSQPGVYALLGTNGAGKTTSIRMMLNMLSRDGGQVLWNGEPLDISRCNVGYLAEERGLYPKYALMDQLLYFASLRDVPRAEAKRRIRYWAERLEVTEYLYPNAAKPEAALMGRRRSMLGGGAKREMPKRPDQLSKGNQQKIQLMAALLSDPELLILGGPVQGDHPRGDRRREIPDYVQPPDGHGGGILHGPDHSGPVQNGAAGPPQRYQAQLWPGASAAENRIGPGAVHCRMRGADRHTEGI